MASNELDVIEHHERVLASGLASSKRLQSLIDIAEELGDVKTLVQQRKDLEPILKKTKAKTDHENKLKGLGDTLFQIKKEKEKIKKLNETKKEIELELKDFETCPLCHQKMIT